jgi:hypothetical protein
MKARTLGCIALVGLACACGALAEPKAAGDSPEAGTSAFASALGSPCVPSQEDLASFSGFDVDEVVIDPRNSGCGAAACLIDHFQGRVTCPYGQDFSGQGPPGATACALPGTGGPVSANNVPEGQTVEAQCTDRTAASTVFCSCRCANANGATDDGATYCTCPPAMTCTQLVLPALSPPDGGLDTISGAYCVNPGAAYDAGEACSETCNPVNAPCP